MPEDVNADNNAVHGYNPKYRCEGTISGLAHQAFCKTNPRSRQFSQFNVEHVSVVGPGSANYQNVTDHQGHIVPQNMLTGALEDVLNDMVRFKVNGHGIQSKEDVRKYICGCYDEHTRRELESSPYTFLKRVYNYGDYLEYKYGYDFLIYDNNQGTDLRGKLENLFSIIVWNPINICRAPKDSERGGEPSEEIDERVVNYLHSNIRNMICNDQNIKTDELRHESYLIAKSWVQALTTLKNEPNPSNQHVRNYIKACCKTLSRLLQHPEGLGFYKFPWVVRDGALYPKGQDPA